MWQAKEHPSALFISNYNMCLEAITAIGNLKIKIPEEFFIVTFDDIEFSIICKPNLTAVRQPIEQIAKATPFKRQLPFVVQKTCEKDSVIEIEIPADLHNDKNYCICL